MSTVVSPESNNSNEANNAPTRNIFEDPALAEAAKNDPFTRFVVKNWVAILVGLGAIAFVMLAYSRFTATQAERQAEATQSVRTIQESYDDLVAKQEEIAKLQGEGKSESAEKVQSLQKEIEQIREKTKLMIDALEASGSFAGIAQLYRGLIAARVGDMEQTRAVLASSSWEQTGSPDSAERFVAELTTYALAKSLLDSDAHVSLAKQTLVAIAERGTVAAAQSVQALATVAQTEEERAEVKKLGEGVAKRLPRQQKYLLNPYGD